VNPENQIALAEEEDAYAPLVGGEEEEEEEEEEKDESNKDGPPRRVGEEVTLKPGLEELNGLKPEELCTVIFGNIQYGNYKLKRKADERELFWFKSNQLYGDAERGKIQEEEAAKVAALEAKVNAAVLAKEKADAEKAKIKTVENDKNKEEEEEAEQGSLAEFHVEPGIDQKPASTLPKTTTMIIKELFNHSQSEGAREEVLVLLAALHWRMHMPFLFGRHHVATFASMHGEAMCLEYLQREMWLKDFMLASIVLNILEPAVRQSDQVCMRFSAAGGREIVKNILDRFGDDLEITQIVPLVLKQAIVRSAGSAKHELVRMKRALDFCHHCRHRYYQHGLFGTHHPHLCLDAHASDVVNHVDTNSVFDRPGQDLSNATDIERSMVPSGDTTFWFGPAVVGRYRRGERNGLSATSKKRSDRTATLALGPMSTRPKTTEAGALTSTTTIVARTANPHSEVKFGARAQAAREEDAEDNERLIAEVKTKTDTNMLTRAIELMTIFNRTASVCVAGLELLLHYSVDGDIRAIIDSGVCAAITAAMRTFHNGTTRSGRQVLWRGCSITSRLAQRSDLLKAELGKAETVDECLLAIGQSPNDRPLQQQALWAIHYCCLHTTIRTRLMGPQEEKGKGNKSDDQAKVNFSRPIQYNHRVCVYYF